MLSQGASPSPESQGVLASVSLRLDPERAEEQFRRASEGQNQMYALVYLLYGLSFDCSRADKVVELIDVAGRLSVDALGKAVAAVKRPQGMDPAIESFLKTLQEGLRKRCDGVTLLGAADEALRFNLREPAAAIATKVIERMSVDEGAMRKQGALFMRAVRIVMASDKYKEASEIMKGSSRVFVGTKESADIDRLGLEIETKLFELKAQAARESGSFRELVRDSEGQRAARESEQRVLSAESLDEQLKLQGAEYRQNPTNVQAIERYVARLIQTGDQAEALRILEKGYSEIGEKRLFHRASELRVRMEESRLNADAGGAMSEEARMRLLGLRLAEMKRRVQIDPEVAQLHRELGALYLENPDTVDSAVACVQRSLVLDGASKESLVLLARAFARLGQVDEVLAVCERVESSIPEEERQPWKSTLMLQLTFERARALATRGNATHDASLLARAKTETARVCAVDSGYPGVAELRELISRGEAH